MTSLTVGIATFCDTRPHDRDSRKNMRGGGVSESLKISFFEAVYGFRVSFLSMCIL